jgi:flavin reductase (DIM6/NTAB) family NADH-FMN oxidoreductase RutF
MSRHQRCTQEMSFNKPKEFEHNSVKARTASLAEVFRFSMRGVASSVTIISTQLGSVRHGMVATAVVPVSMDPPSVVLGINRAASIHDPLEKRGAFAINFLSEKSESIARKFSEAKGEERFLFGKWLPEKNTSEFESTSLPYLADAQAVVLCKLRDVHRSGTHSLFVGEVSDVLLTDALSPLLYFNGGYGSFCTADQTRAVLVRRD